MTDKPTIPVRDYAPRTEKADKPRQINWNGVAGLTLLFGLGLLIYWLAYLGASSLLFGEGC